jgi:predicted component of type VI protein secretion system
MKEINQKSIAEKPKEDITEAYIARKILASEISIKSYIDKKCKILLDTIVSSLDKVFDEKYNKIHDRKYLKVPESNDRNNHHLITKEQVLETIEIVICENQIDALSKKYMPELEHVR